MGKKSRTSVLKRQREIKKAERAALKQAQRQKGEEPEERGGGGEIATQDDLAGYGLAPESSDEEEEA